MRKLGSRVANPPQAMEMLLMEPRLDTPGLTYHTTLSHLLVYPIIIVAHKEQQRIVSVCNNEQKTQRKNYVEVSVFIVNRFNGTA